MTTSAIVAIAASVCWLIALPTFVAASQRERGFSWDDFITLVVFSAPAYIWAALFPSWLASAAVLIGMIVGQYHFYRYLLVRFGKPRRRRGIGAETYPDDWDELRRAVYRRDGYTCSNCGDEDVELHAHHIVPLSVGGTNNMSNLITLCENCHRRIHPHMRD